MKSFGFILIGESAFESEDSPSKEEALSACNSIGGDVVLVMIPEYVGSQTYAYQTSRYHPGHSYTQTSTTYYNDFTYGSGVATTTTTCMTPGYTTMQTNYITIQRNRYGALFFKRKVKGTKYVLHSSKH